MTKTTKSIADVAAMARSRHPLIWITTREEARVERALIEVAKELEYEPRTWDAAQGMADYAGKPVFGDNPDVGFCLNTIREQAASGGRNMWIMRDLPSWLDGPIGMITRRQLKNLARALPQTPRKTAQTIVILSPSGDVPQELGTAVTMIDWPLPEREDIADVLDKSIAPLPEELRATACPNGMREAAIDAAVGLTASEAQSCFAKSLVQLRCIDPATVASEKKRVVTREKVLEWHDPIAGGLDAVGGLEVLKGWLTLRRSAYSAKARAYGIPSPRGIVLVGVPGCGKSLMAKAVATAWGIPLLRLDLGALKGKFVGESEANIRRAFQVIEALGRCVVWVDEIEKALQGATSGSSDGGVSSDALGALLSWMQDRAGEAFVVATANDANVLPPELLRKGRFDEVFWVDLPHAIEREAVLGAALRLHGRGAVAATLDTKGIAQACAGFSGAEIAAVVPDALFAAFNDGAREITTEDLLTAAETVVPLAETAKAKITALRAWAVGKARAASTPEQAPDKDMGVLLDLA